jgi:diaminopimelate decarboxylase
MTTGAYGYSLSSNYNARLRPAEVLVDGDKYYQIREREKVEELHY